MRLTCLALACLLVAVEARGQVLASSDVAQTSGVFRSAIDLVALSVVVTDNRQAFVNGLDSGDFSVFEDGVRQEVTYFSAGDAPLDLVMLLDTSASMSASMPVVRQAAKGLLATLHPGDRAMVVDVKSTSRVLYPLGPDVAAAAAAVQITKADGNTGLFNALYTTLKDLDRERQSRRDQVRRQAIVVVSDGADTSSLVSFDDVMDLAKESGIAVYTITISSPPVPGPGARSAASVFDPSRYGMKSLSQETGARAFFPADVRELKAVYGTIATELASQYAIAYVPTNQRADGAFRRVLVSVTARPDARARTRSGYTPRASRTPRSE